MSVELVTIGEILVRLSGGGPGSLAVGDEFRVSIAGAEGNVAIAAARLGVDAGWMGRIGDDDGGRLALRTLRAERVDISGARVDREAPTALLLNHRRTADATHVTYYRSQSAGSRLRPSDVSEELVRNARVLHVTGITPALGHEPARAISHSIDIARQAGVIVSFDVNYRRTLWAESDAKRVLTDMAASADIVFASPGELSLIGDDPLALIRGGARQVIVKDGGNGATVTHEKGVIHEPARSVTVTDPVGAGDAFVGGYLSGLVRGLNLTQCLQQAVVVGAVAVSTIGDWEGLPHQLELAGFCTASDNVRR